LNTTTFRPFTISRTFDAPRDRVWRAWTDAEQLKQWWGPKGFLPTHVTNDMRPGGLMHYRLKGPDGTQMWGKWTYRQIDPPQRLIAVTSFSDERGGIGRHPMAPDWPLEMLSTFKFSESGGKTKIDVEWSALNATPAEQQVFDSSHDSCRIGWTGTFDQLEAYLARSPY
jgi:uncharacterized protein YndB with AHSA1/START domain